LVTISHFHTLPPPILLRLQKDQKVTPRLSEHDDVIIETETCLATYLSFWLHSEHWLFSVKKIWQPCFTGETAESSKHIEDLGCFIGKRRTLPIKYDVKGCSEQVVSVLSQKPQDAGDGKLVRIKIDNVLARNVGMCRKSEMAFQRTQVRLHSPVLGKFANPAKVMYDNRFLR